MTDQLSYNIWRCWRTLGIPVAIDPVDERTEGIVDPEALIVLTVLFEDDPRILGDIAGWLTENDDLLIAQKLSVFMLRGGRGDLEPNKARLVPLRAMPTKLRKALALPGARSPKATSTLRRHKLAPRDAIAKNSRVMFNRLYHGVSARADIITALEIESFQRSGIELARLLGVNASTVSRVKGDLRDCGVLGPRSLRTEGPRLPGYFVSSETVSNQAALADAMRVKDGDLRRSMIPDIDERLDKLSLTVVPEGG